MTFTALYYNNFKVVIHCTIMSSSHLFEIKCPHFTVLFIKTWYRGYCHKYSHAPHSETTSFTKIWEVWPLWLYTKITTWIVLLRCILSLFLSWVQQNRFSSCFSFTHENKILLCNRGFATFCLSSSVDSIKHILEYVLKHCLMSPVIN